MQKRAARFVTGNYKYEIGSMTVKMGIPHEKGGKTIDLYCYIKVSKVKPVHQQKTFFQKLGVVEISLQKLLPPGYQGLDSLISSAEDAEDCVAKFILW